ncbi:M20 aminoacylase family protein [Variovorax sp. J22G73]|uniref:M20 aminoacylase family protein n=1 Tax=unclassified Variovorax TaxID=663243 RepID=UPI00257748A1|nr:MULTISPECIES: M20 aminoacylase family protein [unclassified Variovorax]MDM0005407.1 M20 aminoacylase family protein [Variovorax sp. J22R203]MDM0098823.1 M20 aminoacylase family protein [Variovorax sp. J22G73]
MALIDAIVARTEANAALRRDIHAHPELRYEEFRTADLVAAELTQCGIDVHRGLARTGVVGSLRQGSGSRSIGLRADMDALRVTELNTFGHASTHPGKMHACGHDGHVAMLLAAARHLAQTRRFDGTVHFIFQPAEEGGAGARAMIDDGLFDRFPVDAVFGMHNWPGMAEGHFAVSPGGVMASSTEFTVIVHGKGGHAALPHAAVDPVPVACELVQAFQTILSRNKSPDEAAVLTVTVLQAGQSNNVIADNCELRGTIRTFSLATLDLIEQRMTQIASHVCSAHDARSEVRFNRSYPHTVNSAAEADFARGVMAGIVGEGNVLVQEPAMTAEDFAFMLQARPGAYAFIGNGDGAHRAMPHGPGPCSLHNPSYDFNDALIPLGATYWVRLVERFLG